MCKLSHSGLGLMSRVEGRGRGERKDCDLALETHIEEIPGVAVSSCV